MPALFVYPVRVADALFLMGEPLAPVFDIMDFALFERGIRTAGRCHKCKQLIATGELYFYLVFRDGGLPSLGYHIECLRATAREIYRMRDRIGRVYAKHRYN